ncbi:MAG TPA: glycosyltransferase family 1 protein [Armatimonadota bacterium]|nr:glycosyltransferase family 1 protein [Armatimonadota bacterium]
MIVGLDARFLTHPQHGGFKTYTRSVVSSLAAVDGENRYLIYTDRPDPTLQLPANFVVRPVSAPNAVMREQVFLPIAMWRDGVDIAHFPCNTAPILFGPRMVVTIHDAIPMRRRVGTAGNQSIKQRLLHRYWRAVMPRSAQRADIVITDSNHSLADVRAHLNVPADKIRVVLPTIDPLFTGERPGIPPAEMRSAESFVLAFASTDGRKNHAGAISAYRAVATDHPGLKLALVCSHPSVRARVASEAGNGVIPLGPVSAEELLWLYRNALALVFPSFDEGLGLPPLEAMACGTPVVASEGGSLREMLEGRAVFVDPHNPDSIAGGMKQVLEDRAPRAGLSSKGRDYASLVSRERMGRELIAAYMEAMHQGRGVME